MTHFDRSLKTPEVNNRVSLAQFVSLPFFNLTPGGHDEVSDLRVVDPDLSERRKHEEEEAAPRSDWCSVSVDVTSRILSEHAKVALRDPENGRRGRRSSVINIPEFKTFGSVMNPENALELLGPRLAWNMFFSYLFSPPPEKKGMKIESCSLLSSQIFEPLGPQIRRLPFGSGGRRGAGALPPPARPGSPLRRRQGHQGRPTHGTHGVLRPRVQLGQPHPR